MSSSPDFVSEELAALENGALDPTAFPHREHLRLGWEMLRRHQFVEAALRVSSGLRRLSTKAGKPEVYNETITLAFLALIGERQARLQSQDWNEFIEGNPDLVDKRILERWYDPAELRSEIARTTLILPRPARS